jgi:hypothetical protein
MLDFTPVWCYYGVMVRLTLRLPDELHKALKELAQRERRSLQAQILYILELYVMQNRDNSQA